MQKNNSQVSKLTETQQDVAHNKVKEGVTHPNGWEPGVKFDYKTKTGTITSRAMTSSTPEFDELLQEWGFDPKKYAIVNDTLRVSTWDMNVGKGEIVKTAAGTFHTPSWIKVHEQTTTDDIIVEHRPFDELFTSEEESRAHYEPRKFASTSSDKTYTVRLGKNGFYCDCWGYLGHKKCKQVKQAQEEWDMS